MTDSAVPRRWTMWLCRCAAAGLIALWVTTRLGWAQYYVLRVLYQGLEWAGWMDKSKGLGGQVAGYNFWREPIWLRQIANLLCHLMVIAPLLLLILVLWERCSARWHWKPCAACGKWNWTIATACLACGAHGAPNASGSSSQKWMTASGSALVRAGAISASFCAALLWLMKVLEVPFYLRQNVFLKIGEALGGDVVYLGRMMMGPNGPFHGDGWSARAFNAAYMHGPELVMLSAAACATVIGARLLIMRRFVKVRSDGVCESCGYSLAGITSLTCPECGGDNPKRCAAMRPLVDAD